MTIPIIDTHQHLIYFDKWNYSWTKGISRLEVGSFTLGNYLHEIEGTAIAGSVFMETTPDKWHEETAHVYDLAAQPDSCIKGVIAACHPEDDDIDRYVDSIRNESLVGLRRICHVEPDEFSQQRKFIDNVRRIGRLGLTFDLCFLARQLPIAFKLAQNCPDVQFILDHCGVPDIAGRALDPWREDIRNLAALPNVACKISGVLAYCKPDNATNEAVRPYIEHSIDCFGWDRVVWGSDWPVCNLTATLRQWLATSIEIFGNASEVEQHKLFHENATRIYRLKRQ